MSCIACDTTVGNQKILITSQLEMTYCPECFHIHIPKNDIIINEVGVTFEEHEAILLRTVQSINEKYPDLSKILIVHPDDLLSVNANIFDISSNTMGKEITMLAQSDLYNHTTTHECVVLYHLITHTPLFNQLLQDAKGVLQSDGKMIVHTKMTNMFRNSYFVFRDLFDTQQISFFSTNAIKHLTEKNGLYIENIMTLSEENNTYSQHRIYTLSKTRSLNVCRSVVDAFIEEIENDLYVPSTYTSYEVKYYLYKYTLQNWISQTRLSGYDVVSYHCRHYFAFFDIPSHFIDHIVDNNQGVGDLTIPNANLLLAVFDTKLLIDNIDEVWTTLLEKAGTNVLNAYVLNCI